MEIGDVSIIIITEKGRLEAESKLLVDSIRTFGGQFSQVPIYSYQPRIAYPISQQTKLFFERNEVVYVDTPVNTKHVNYTLANKVYTSAHAEKNINTKVIVFMDSDSVVWQEPKSFFMGENDDVALVPVFRKIGLAVDKTDVNYKYWKRIEKLFQISFDDYVQTIVDNEKVLSYYNSGLQVVKKECHLFQTAEENFEKLLDEDSSFFQHRFLEQVNFSATAIAMGLKIKDLGKGYNYPLKHYGNIKNPNYKVDDLGDVVTGHYTTLFKKAKFSNPLKAPIFESGKGEWFKRKAIEYGVYTPWYKKLWS